MITLKKLQRRLLSLGFRPLRRVLIFIVGMSVILVGVAMLVLPGPGLLVVPAGLAILALEFRWARRLLKRARTMVSNLRTSNTHQKPPTGLTPPKTRDTEPAGALRDD